MYKRVAKHARKKAEEEALGLDEEMKDVLGLQDTDDSESDSSSSDEDEDASDGDASGSGDEGASQDNHSSKLKRKLEGLYNDDEADGPGSDSQAEDSEDEDDDEDSAGPSAQEALEDPLYEIPAPKGSQSCAICPGRVFKNLGMAKDHVASAAHGRRHKRFVSATDALRKSDVDLDTVSAASVVAVMAEKPEFASTSKESAKSRRKRKRDRGGKQKREEREKARAAEGGAPVSIYQEKVKPKKIGSAKVAKPDDQEKVAAPKTKPPRKDGKPTTKPSNSASDHAERPSKRARRGSIPKTKVRVVDVK